MTNFSDKLLAWYDEHHRALPWREQPQPYYILVSEFMLQQTRMDTVLPYFDRFLSAFPTIDDLATASLDEVLKLWEGLGYYRRARHLHTAAREIVERYDSRVPSDPAVLKSLPGIGDYVAGAIASTAYQVRATALDGNVARILSRLDCNDSDLSKAKPKRELQARLLDMLPDERVGDFNQALMELGALICLPNGRPLCDSCPVASFCCAYQTADPLDFPLKKAKRKVPVQPKTVLVCRHGNSVLLEQFGPGLLEGLSAFPMLDGHLSAEQVAGLYPGATITALPPARHVFSHLIWDMIGYQVDLISPVEGDWTSLDELSQRTFPTALASYRQTLVES